MTQQEIDESFGALCYEAYVRTAPPLTSEEFFCKWEQLPEGWKQAWIAAAKAVRSAFAASVLT